MDDNQEELVIIEPGRSRSGASSYETPRLLTSRYATSKKAQSRDAASSIRNDTLASTEPHIQANSGSRIPRRRFPLRYIQTNDSNSVNITTEGAVEASRLKNPDSPSPAKVSRIPRSPAKSPSKHFSSHEKNYSTVVTLEKSEDAAEPLTSTEYGQSTARADIPCEVKGPGASAEEISAQQQLHPTQLSPLSSRIVQAFAKMATSIQEHLGHHISKACARLDLHQTDLLSDIGIDIPALKASFDGPHGHAAFMERICSLLDFIDFCNIRQESRAKVVDSIAVLCDSMELAELKDELASRPRSQHDVEVMMEELVAEVMPLANDMLAKPTTKQEEVLSSKLHDAVESLWDEYHTRRHPPFMMRLNTSEAAEAMGLAIKRADAAMDVRLRLMARWAIDWFERGDSCLGMLVGIGPPLDELGLVEVDTILFHGRGCRVGSKKNEEGAE